ncbi:MAG TPA: RcnB family protein [Rhizomicrobium sp.]
MRMLLISAAITALFVVPALAQPDGHDEHGHGGGQGGSQQQHGGPPGGGHAEHGGGEPHGGQGPSFGRGPNGGGNSGRPTMTTNQGYSRGPNGGGNPGHPTMATNPGYSRGPNGGGFDHSAPSNQVYTRGPNGGGNFHGGDNFRPQGGPSMASREGQGGGPGRGPGAGSRHDFHGFTDFHQSFRAAQRFHAPAYRRPAGWYSHRWTFGEFLPAAFWARDYWLMDYMDFGLAPPPPYAVWVRYGDDALLIDQDSGEIITVEYGVFY